MDEGRLLVFVEKNGGWAPLLADLRTSGAECTEYNDLQAVLDALAQGDCDGILTSKALLEAHPELGASDVLVLLADELSDATDARFAQSPRDIGSMRFAPPRIEQVDRREVIELWSQPWLLLVLAMALAAEWSLRRRWGRL